MDDRRFPENRNPGIVLLPNVRLDSEAMATRVRRVLDIVAPFRRFWLGAKVDMTAEDNATLRVRAQESGAMEEIRYRFGPNGTEEWVD